MTYTGLELFMDNLKQLSYSKHNPLINNNPEILLERRKIKLLYNELDAMIETLFIGKENNFNELEQVKNLQTRFKDVAQKAHSIVGLFVYTANYKNIACPPTRYDLMKYSLNRKLLHFRGINNERSLNLKNVMRDMKSIKKEFIMIRDSLKMNSSPSIVPLKMLTAAAAARSSCTRNLLIEETFVRIDHDAELIRDTLVEDEKKLDVVCVVGMGGVGKTTLATKVFNDPYLVHHFHVRAWVTVSQTYEKRDLLIQILSFMDIELDLVSASYSSLRGDLHKRLMGKRYLIVVDDIWSIEAWNDLKLFFPNGNIGSRILLTSRLKEVALHATSHGLIHQLECLTDKESWELLCKKVFRGNDCPESLIEPGMQIAQNCHGLPLSVVVIAGVLAKVAPHKDSWEIVSQKVSSYIVRDKNGQTDILGLSYEHLPPHLKDCFLYLGGLPEDYKFRLRKLIWLWMAEGFVQEDGNRSLEEIGEDYMIELVDRNLVVVVDRKYNGAIKACSIHDLLRELCLERARNGNFWMKINKRMSFHHSVREYMPRRIFTTNWDFLFDSLYQPSLSVQSLLCFDDDFSYISVNKRIFQFYPLLTVLDLQKCRLQVFPSDIGLLVHLRYLAFWCYRSDFPSSICNLWSLHTIIVRGFYVVYLPKAISNLVNLRHMWSESGFSFPSLKKPMNLQTISYVTLGEDVESWEKCFRAIKKLTCKTYIHKNQDFGSLNSLETLNWRHNVIGGSQASDRVPIGDGILQNIHVTFPASLKKLSLSGSCLPWSDMSMIQSLPNLEVLKILDRAFLGPRWEAGEARFQQLKFLKLKHLNIQQWEATSINFPRLTHLVLDKCKGLEEIPLEIGDISTLELIDISPCSNSVVESLDRIREEQQNFGNYDLKLNVRK